MLESWRHQQPARNLAFGTINGREAELRRFVAEVAKTPMALDRTVQADGRSARSRVPSASSWSKTRGISLTAELQASAAAQDPRILH
jgi:hypothetical protein